MLFKWSNIDFSFHIYLNPTKNNICAHLILPYIVAAVHQMHLIVSSGGATRFKVRLPEYND